MKIDTVYIGCCKKDYYFTRICIASIRYWNPDIPIILIKDFSKGNFSTAETEKIFRVSIAPINFKQIGGYGKLYPYLQAPNERVLSMDSDIVWLGDVIEGLQKFDEDMIVDGYSPEEYEEETNKWYFDTGRLKHHFPEYTYPGFLFNAGQLVLNTSTFSELDFSGIVDWKENMAPLIKDVFMCEDQGIINYITAKKLKKNEISLRIHHFYLWGWSEEAKSIRVADVRQKKQHPFLIHWHGPKRGLISFLPNSRLLK